MVGCGKRSVITVGAFHGEGVGQMPHLAHGAVLEEHFHDVEAHRHFWPPQQAQVIQGGVCQVPPLGRVHRHGRTGPFLGGAAASPESAPLAVSPAPVLHRVIELEGTCKRLTHSEHNPK